MFAITEEPVWIQGNEQALRRVIQNIIKNELDHGEKEIESAEKKGERNGTSLPEYGHRRRKILTSAEYLTDFIKQTRPEAKTLQGLVCLSRKAL